MSIFEKPGVNPPIVNLIVAEQDLYSGSELKSLLESLYNVEARLVDSPAPGSAASIYVGARHLHRLPSLPELSDQGLIIRSIVDPVPSLVVGGGSSTATLWAVYELGERLGVRYLHDRDVYPARKPFAAFPNFEIVMEPELRIRAWRLINEAPHGPVSWSVHENLRFIRQLAKMKFNRLRIEIWPAQPFLQYTLNGMAKPKGVFYFGEHYDIEDDTVGREQFGEIGTFINPQFAGLETTGDLHEKAVDLVKSMLAEARRLGMETAIALNAAEWPKEFHRVLPGTEPVNQVGSLTIGPGSNQSIHDPILRHASATVIRACAETYAEVDYLILSMPEHGHWTGHAGEAFRNLVSTHHALDVDTFESLCAKARSRTNFPGGGQRVEKQLKNDVSALWFFDSVVQEYQLLKRPGGGPDFKLIYDSLAEELFPLVAQVVPTGGEVVSFLDYTASRQLARRDLLEHIPPPHVPASLIFTLADDNVGILPQLANKSLHALMGLLRQHNWSGFHTRFWTIGDLDPTIHLLARGSWDATLTPREAYIDQVRQVCGEASVEPALAAFGIIEEVTIGLDQHGMGFGFLVPAMMTHHYEAGYLSEDIQQDRILYMQAFELMEKAYIASTPEGHFYIRYVLNRLKFAVRYLDAAEYFSATGSAVRAGLLFDASRYAEQAYQAIQEALQAYADVARDNGDLGAIAAMNQYCYRPIRDKRNELLASIPRNASELVTEMPGVSLNQ